MRKKNLKGEKKKLKRHSTLVGLKLLSQWVIGFVIGVVACWICRVLDWSRIAFVKLLDWSRVGWLSCLQLKFLIISCSYVGLNVGLNVGINNVGLILD